MSEVVELPPAYFHPTAEIEPGALIGKGSKIWHLCHIRAGATIGHSCSLARNVYVDSEVWIGNGVRIQNNVSIYKGVSIEDLAFIGPHVVFTNDIRPRAFPLPGGWKIVHTEVGHGASLGAGAVVVCGHRIGEFAMIGAGAVVCRDILPYEQVVGFSQRTGFVDRDGKII